VLGYLRREKEALKTIPAELGEPRDCARKLALRDRGYRRPMALPRDTYLVKEYRERSGSANVGGALASQAGVNGGGGIKGYGGDPAVGSRD